MNRAPRRRRHIPPHRHQRGTRTAALAAATSVLTGALTIVAPLAVAAPCDVWPPVGTGGGSGSSSSGGGSPAAPSQPAPPAVPWNNGASGYIPILQGRTTTVELLTGRTSPNNTVDRFGITGTDLGILWTNGGAGGKNQVHMALGDTMGDCDGDAQWRSNILFRSSDTTLSNGMRIDDAPLEAPGLAASLLPRSGLPGETTVIPTAGVAVGQTQYLRYMSVETWGDPGEWTTNYSALARSTDNGTTWTPVSGTARTGTGNLALPGNLGAAHSAHAAAQMSAFLQDRGYVYEYLTPSGRNGSAILARVPAAGIENMGAYEFWTESGWASDRNAAKVVLDGQVSELSISWSGHLNRYIALYTDQSNNVVMRQALTPEGPWSGKDILLSYDHLPTLYGAFAHPWSPAIQSNGKDLYFTLSTWDAYNVFLMKSDLSELAPRTPGSETSRARVADDSWTRDTPDPADTGETVLVDRIPIPEA
ncbi:DUF4185 domain-containing protein [uncultured Dietzia sp.]|uniref:DUF4185 domain-containing protein n=1 Tax=uncultured Dietzia sp. TaxID=395519 RepID=UPI0026345B71|nr:DUF4185 domain-containing protein [uncultured Dietzia sp.]